MTIGQRLYELAGHTDIVHSVQFSPDGARLATASQDGTARIWDLASRREIFKIPVGASENIAIAFSPDGKRLAATGIENTVTIWDTESSKELLTLRGHAAPVVGLAFNPDGTQLVSVSPRSEAELRIWDSITGEELLGLEDAGAVIAVAFSPDGKRLAMGSEEGIATIWDAASGKQLFSFFGHTRPIFSVTFTPDGSRLATASGDGTSKLWDTKTGEELLTLFGHTGRVFSVAISPDGSRLATAGQDGNLRVYLLNTEDLVALARSRLTRSLTTEECQKYLHMEVCPSEP
jgi:WD40 repeat protein